MALSLSLPGAAAGNQQTGVGGPGDGQLSGASGPNRSCLIRVVGAQRCPCGRKLGGRASEQAQVEVGGDSLLGGAKGEGVLWL